MTEHARRHRAVMYPVLGVLAGLLIACGDDDRASDGGVEGMDASAEQPPPPDPKAAAAAFKLYYKERMHRLLLSYNRFGLFGDSTFGTSSGSTSVKKQGDEYEIVVRPADNNVIGTTVFGTYYAYKIFKTREAELTLLRMLEGLVFYEAVTGHPGLTAREVVPGWTRVMDGLTGSVSRTRLGEPVESPLVRDSALEQEILSAFFDGVRFTYRENPEETYFSYMPAADVLRYSITYSFDELPRFLRRSDCCASWMKVPKEYTWAGAFWGNHNSRDNFPDIALGFIAAKLAAHDEDMSEAVREVARRADAAGERVGDLIFESGGNMMTVDEHNPYDTLVLSGAQRPHGLPENEDLGALANCPDAFLAKALSTEGLSLPVPELPAPGAATVEGMIAAGGIDCEETTTTCRSLTDAFCGLEWTEFDRITLGGQPALDIIQMLEEAQPGTAETLLGEFQKDYDDIVEAMMAMYHYARAVDDQELAETTREVTKQMSDVMRGFADVIWPDPAAENGIDQRYEAAIFDSLVGAEVIEEHLNDFALEEERAAYVEERLELEDTEPRPLLTDQEIFDIVEAGKSDVGRAGGLGFYEGNEHPSGRDGVIYQRYRDAYGMEPPVRRAGDGYEARRPGIDWAPAEVPRHVDLGRMYLLQAIPICHTKPEVLDCRWAVLGCARPDLNRDGTVDAGDTDAFDAGFESGRGCSEADAWCDGLDLDRSGKLDDLDQAFMKAAEGCHYTPR